MNIDTSIVNALLNKYNTQPTGYNPFHYTQLI